mmetsp:Transcript_24274/g.72844  ORF Transcript_24274/g.72844 Transcript_24274/m.72844 type:complete len:96 (-) Transcript_24274:479-766(-)
MARATTRMLPALVSLALAADQHESCGFWASSGECEKNPGFMLASCADACAAVTAAAARPVAASFFDLSAGTADGATLDFASLRGKTVLVTNVASE